MTETCRSNDCGAAGCAANETSLVDNADTTTRSLTVLTVPAMCCPTEFGMVERELRRIQGVHDVTADFLNRAVRVQHAGLPHTELLGAAQRSGFEAHLPPAAAETAQPSERSVIFINKMDCPTEESLIRNRLRGAAWVQDMSFDLMQRKLTVEHLTGRQSDVLKALEEVGLPGRVDAPSEGQPATAHADASRGKFVKLGIGLALAVAAEVIALSLGDTYWAAVALALAAIALTGGETYRKGWIAVRQGNLNINALMAVAVTGAALIGQWPEAAMVMVLFAVAELIEARSLDRARNAVAGLMAMTPEVATVRTASGWATVPASGVALGTLVRVRPGERIAVDGRVTAGNSAIDQAPITGESVPVDKAPGDPVFAGTINQHGELEYEVTAKASNSTLARIIKAVQEAQATRAPTQRFVDAFSKYYTPAVFAFAIGVALVPPLFLAADWMTWVYRALVMLVIACPCALVISTPVTVVSGLTAAARRGILIKGGLYLEQGHRLTVLALDKTGTLTQGRPTLTDIVPLVGSEAQVLRLAAALSGRSDHPVSRAVVQGAGAAVEPPAVANFAALSGRGIEGTIDGVLYRLGNHRLVEDSGASSPELEARLDALEQQGKTAIVLIGAGKALAVFAIADSVREQSRDAVAQLKALGIRAVMLTGDNRHTAEAIARQVGIDEVRSELLPEEKLRVIEEFAAGGSVVGMVGDGINDAPALAKANIGFAMAAAGTDTAIETADVALMDDDPRKLATFVRLSAATKAVLWQNISFALGIKVIFLALALVGQATLWMAVFADMGASLVVVFNGLRLLRKKF